MARVLVLALLVAACGVSGPVLDPDEHVAGERQRLLQEPVDRLWPAILGALPAEGLRVTHQDRARGAIATAPVRITGGEAQKKLAEIGDLARAHQAGIQRVSELEVRYVLLLAPAGDAGTRLRVRSTIDAIDRSAPGFLGGGLSQLVPRHVEVPSRGVVERDLLRRLAANFFTAEEMLFFLGEPGID
jgi:hypothetical protein